MKQKLSLLTLLFAITTTSLFAYGTAPSGEKLEREVWEAMRNKQHATLEKKLARGFQSLHVDGARNKSQELALMKKLNLTAYTLSDFKVTKGRDTMVVTYRVTVDETIDGKRIKAKNAPRMSVWQKSRKGWQWIAHSNMSAFKK